MLDEIYDCFVARESTQNKADRTSLEIDFELWIKTTEYTENNSANESFFKKAELLITGQNEKKCQLQ